MTVSGGFNYVDVRDVVQTMLNLIDGGVIGETYLLAGAWHAIGKLSKIIEEISGSPAPKLHLPLWLAHIIARGHMLRHWLLNEKPLYTNQSITSVGSFRGISDTKARRELGHKSRPIEQTLYDLLNWYQQQGMLSNKIQLKQCCRIVELNEGTLSRFGYMLSSRN